MSLLHLTNPHRNNRYEVFFADASSQEEQDILRLSCHTVEKITEDLIKFVFFDFEGNKEYNSVNKLVRQNLGSHSRISVVCYDGRHEVYETLSITGILSTEPIVDLSWASNSSRNLVVYATSAIVTSARN